MEVMSGPLIQTLENRLEHNQERAKELLLKKQELQEEIKRLEAENAKEQKVAWR